MPHQLSVIGLDFKQLGKVTLKIETKYQNTIFVYAHQMFLLTPEKAYALADHLVDLAETIERNQK